MTSKSIADIGGAGYWMDKIRQYVPSYSIRLDSGRIMNIFMSISSDEVRNYYLSSFTIAGKRFSALLDNMEDLTDAHLMLCALSKDELERIEEYTINIPMLFEDEKQIEIGGYTFDVMSPLLGYNVTEYKEKLTDIFKAMITNG